MAAEVIKYFFPRLVDLHNYIPANSTPQKLSNWNLLNRKVFSKLNFHVPEETVKKIVLNTAGVIEPVLSALREKIDRKLEHTTDNILDLEYFDTRNHEKPHAEIRQAEAKLLAQVTGEEKKKDEKSRLRNSKPQHTVQFYTDMDPTLRTVLQEKEQAVMALQETVEVHTHTKTAAVTRKHLSLPAFGESQIRRRSPTPVIGAASQPQNTNRQSSNNQQSQFISKCQTSHLRLHLFSEASTSSDPDHAVFIITRQHQRSIFSPRTLPSITCSPNIWRRSRKSERISQK
ncbi:sperm flagellar protein 1 [Lates japonicus]|uniref:Sperm flagellar protein 1 n=1 Tax=Lates japonicus TaxID=270547 RepID=A0AAD3N9Y4_LATJO|nr:sperm flagellar protein 1 [Lates japonicus]